MRFARRGGWVAAGLLGGLLLWWASRSVPETPEVPRQPQPVPRPLAVPPPAPSLPVPAPADPTERALQHLAEAEGAWTVECPEPGFDVARGPFLRAVRHQGRLFVLVADERGEGLLYAEPQPGDLPSVLAGPAARVRWDVASGACGYDDVPFGVVTGMVSDGEVPVTGTWVVGCGAAMEAVDEEGRFTLDAPVGEPCRLQAEARGEGVWVVPDADLPQEVVVPWTKRAGDEREEVALRFRRALEELDALEGMEDPVAQALEDPELPSDLRTLLQGWQDEEVLRRVTRRRWLEQALRRYERPPPIVDEDAPDVWMDGDLE